MKSIYYYAERDCYDDSSERTALAYIEARIVGAKAAKRAVENAIDGGQMYRGTVMGKVLPGNQWLLVSGHALERGIQRNISRSEITAHFDKFLPMMMRHLRCLRTALNFALKVVFLSFLRPANCPLLLSLRMTMSPSLSKRTSTGSGLLLVGISTRRNGSTFLSLPTIIFSFEKMGW